LEKDQLCRKKDKGLPPPHPNSHLSRGAERGVFRKPGGKKTRGGAGKNKGEEKKTAKGARAIRSKKKSLQRGGEGQAKTKL